MRPRAERSSSVVSTSAGLTSSLTMVMVRSDVAGVEALALLEQHHELVEEPADPLGVLAVDGDLVAAHDDVRPVERLFDQPQQLVSLTEQAHHEVVPGDEDLDLGRRHGRSLRGYQQVHATPPAERLTPAARPIAVPPTTWRWRWGTEFEASSPTLNTQPVAALGDPLRLGHLPGGHEHVGQHLGVAGLDGGGIVDVAARARRARARGPGG